MSYIRNNEREKIVNDIINYMQKRILRHSDYAEKYKNANSFGLALEHQIKGDEDTYILESIANIIRNGYDNYSESKFDNNRLGD